MAPVRTNPQTRRSRLSDPFSLLASLRLHQTRAIREDHPRRANYVLGNSSDPPSTTTPENEKESPEVPPVNVGVRTCRIYRRAPTKLTACSTTSLTPVLDPVVPVDP